MLFDISLIFANICTRKERTPRVRSFPCSLKTIFLGTEDLGLGHAWKPPQEGVPALGIHFRRICEWILNICQFHWGRMTIHKSPKWHSWLALELWPSNSKQTKNAFTLGVWNESGRHGNKCSKFYSLVSCISYQHKLIPSREDRTIPGLWWLSPKF